MKKLDPIDNGVNMITKIGKGNVMVKCKNIELVKKLQQNAQEKLGDHYTIKKPQKSVKKAKIIGLSEKFNEIEIVDYLKKQNNIINEDEIKVIKIYKNHNT